MLQTKYKTNSLMRCKNLGFVIPLSSGLALLLGLVAVINPSTDIIYALENANGAVSNDNGINTTSAQADTTTSLIIDTPKLTTAGEVGELLTMSSNVSVSATSIDSYTLQISGNPQLEGPTNITTTTNDATSLDDNTWGYSWNGSSYSGITNTPTTIDTSGVNNYTVNYTKPLTFAVKFGDSAEAGHYKTQVNLLLTAAPRKVASWDELQYMQDMNSGACEEAPLKMVKKLIDIRDDSEYAIIKYSDGKCWMQDNLRIVNKEISADNSDLETGTFIIPASSLSNFNDASNSHAYISGVNGYYNWYTATAGHGTSSVSSSTLNESICPKGWKLPTSNDLALFASSEGITSSSLSKIRSSPYNFTHIGYIVKNGLRTDTNESFWWSSTAGSTSELVIGVYINYNYSYVYFPTTTQRYYGAAIRCIARS